MLMRGGTSKGGFLLAEDLPSDPDARNDLLLRIVGSPDPRQIDGIGGAHPLTTKIAIVSPNTDGRADVDYLFLQPSVEAAVVSDSQNCGNMLAAVGPFAIERGLVEVTGPTAEVRIRMVNTDSVAVARFALNRDGRPMYDDGDFAIDGVPGTAAPIRLDFEDIAGSSCGSAFPTGNTVDVVGGVRCTLIDFGMPVVVMRADDVGVSGDETCAELETDGRLRALLEEIRLAAGPMMHLGDVTTNTVPKLTIVSGPRNGGSLTTRTFIPHRCHDAIGVLGAVSVAVAALTPGTPAADVLARPEGSDSDLVVLEHPTGRFETSLTVTNTGVGEGAGAGVVVERAGIVRTARKLMDGTVVARSRT